MNKIYKTKNTVNGTVAASELAKGHSKSIKLAVAATAALVAGQGFAADIQVNQVTNGTAASVVSNETNSTFNTEAYSRPTELQGKIRTDDTGAMVKTNTSVTSYGFDNHTKAGGATVYGAHNSVYEGSVAEDVTIIGVDNKIVKNDAYEAFQGSKQPTWNHEERLADREGTIIVGSQNTVEEAKTVTAIGRNIEVGASGTSKDGNDGMVQNVIAIGDGVKVKHASQAVNIGRDSQSVNSHGAVAIGSVSKVDNAYGGTSLGLLSNTKTVNGVALGSFSTADRAAVRNAVTAGEGADFTKSEVYALHIANDQDKADIAATVKGTLGAVSVGNADQTRQITNVAAGSADSDAVNVAQLQAVANVLPSLKTEVKAGDNITVNETIGDNGQTIYTINGNPDTNTVTTVTAGSDNVTVTEAVDAAGNKTFNVAVKDTTEVTSNSGDLNVTRDGDKFDLSISEQAKQEIVDRVKLPKVAGGENVTVSETKDADGSTVYTVTAKDTRNTTVAGKNITVDTKAQADGSVEYTINAKGVTAGSNFVNVVDNGDNFQVDVAPRVKNAVELAESAVQNFTVEVNGQAVKTVGNKGTVGFVAGDNIQLGSDANGNVTVATTSDVKHNSVTVGDVVINQDGINAGDKKITNVAPAEISATSQDAVNGSQLHATNQNVQNVNNRVDAAEEQIANAFNKIDQNAEGIKRLADTIQDVKKDSEAGIAGANAAAALPQAHRAGQSMIGAAVGGYGSQAALAVGASAISDSGRWTVKGQLNVNTRAKVGYGVGIGFNF